MQAVIQKICSVLPSAACLQLARQHTQHTWLFITVSTVLYKPAGGVLWRVCACTPAICGGTREFFFVAHQPPAAILQMCKLHFCLLKMLIIMSSRSIAAMVSLLIMSCHGRVCQAWKGIQCDHGLCCVCLPVEPEVTGWLAVWPKGMQNIALLLPLCFWSALLLAV